MTAEEAFVPLLLGMGVFFCVTPWLNGESHRVRRVAFFALLALELQYLYWRFTSSLPGLDTSSLLVVSYASVYLLIELLLALVSFRFLNSLKQVKDRKRDADEAEGWFSQRARLPLIDILIPTYNEPWSIVERTVVGALAQDYPRCRVWVLDDGRRAPFAEHCTELGASYLTRADNRFAKSGNLNSALEVLFALDEAPEFVAVLDADFVPRRRFISRCLALMRDSSVGLVQTPQNHFNPDPFQTSFRAWTGWPDTQRFAFGTILPAREAAGRAYCCGTSFLIRTEALRAISGFPTESITEDVLTSMKIGMRGWRTTYLNEILTTGLAPEGVHEYLTQRGRWCLGGVQIGLWYFRTTRGREPLWRRLLVLEGFLRWGYTAVLRVLFMLVPLVYWYSGIAPFDTTPLEVIFFAFPVVLLQRSYVSWLSQGSQLALIAPGQNLLASFAVVPALFKGLFGREQHRFVVTDKGKHQAGVVIHSGPLRWLLGYSALLLIGIFFLPTASATGAFRSITMLWSVYYLATIAVAAAPCVEAPRRRGEERYSTREHAGLEPGVAQPAQVRLCDISVSGALLEAPGALRVGAELVMTVRDVGPLRARVVRRARCDAWGVAFDASDAQRHALIRKIFCSDAYILPPQTGSAAVAFAKMLRKALV